MLQLDDDASIPDAEELYRRLAHSSPDLLVIDALTGQRRPSSGAFKPDDDGVSVYRSTVLRGKGMGAADIVVRSDNLVVSATVADVRALSLGVRDDPWPSGLPGAQVGHPRNAAHALIVGWGGLTRSDRRRKQKALTEVPSLRFVYP